MGDEHHSARLSDHNPDAAWVVHAIDITHDPKDGFDSYAFADMLLAKQDKRLKYVISNRRIRHRQTDEVLKDFGFDVDEIAALKKAKVV